MTSLEIKDAMNVAETRCRKIIDLCKTEVREMTDDEEKEIEDLKREIEDKKEELKKLEASLEEKPEEEDEEEQEDKKEENSEDEDKKDKNNTQERNMKKEAFSLLRAIRNVANGKALEAVDAAVVNAGAEEMRKSKLQTEGQIQIPSDVRALPTVVKVDTYDTGEEHDDVVVTDFQSILEPLRANNVLAAAGAKILTGCVGDIQVPRMSKTNVFWEGEIDDAQDGAPTFDNVKLQPHRLTAYIDISKQFLAQDSLDAESLIRKDLVAAIYDKLEATILGTADNNSNKQPAGLFYNVTATEVSTFADICNLEAEVEEENFNGSMKYILSPKAKAGLRAMAKSSKHTELVYQNNEIDGTPAEVTTNIAKGNFAYGDWSNLAIAQWAGIDLTVDPYTKAAAGQVRLVINCFFDAKMLRDNAIVYGELGE